MESSTTSIAAPNAKSQRPGQHIQSGECAYKITRVGDAPLGDLLLTVTEVTSGGAIRLAITGAEVNRSLERVTSKQKANSNCLILKRPVGTSVVIRKCQGVDKRVAAADLAKNGIILINRTKSLGSAGHKTGSSIMFITSASIWKIIRLELTNLEI